MAVSNLAYSNSQACDICNITTYLVLLRILLQLHESTPFLATTQKLIYIKALCRGGGLSNNHFPCAVQYAFRLSRACELELDFWPIPLCYRQPGVSSLAPHLP